MTIERRLRMSMLLQIVPLAKSTIYQKISKGTFPKPRKLGARAVCWLESEILIWLEEQNQNEVEK